MEGTDRPFYNIPCSVASGRIRQLFENANFDAADPNWGASLEAISSAPSLVTEGTLIYKLIKKNQELYDSFLNNRLCKGMALGILPQSAYQDFAKQDYLYLLDNVRFKALRFAKLNPTTPFDDLRAQSQKIAGAVDITEDWKTMCTDELGIPASEMESIEPSAAEIGYASFLNGQTTIDDWFSLYIITIPCIYGWSQIAKRLDEDPQTDRTTVFYRTFIEPNLNDKSGRKLCQFIEANRPFWTSDITENAWDTLFRTALKFEIGLFDSVLVQTPDFALPSAAIHGNCVFSDADQPAEIRHLSGQAVVGPSNRGGGLGSSTQSKIHFPLGPMPNLSAAIANHGMTTTPKLWLQVDCDQTERSAQRAGATEIETGGSARDDYAGARIIRAEVYIGCSCVASKDFIPPKMQTFRETMDGMRFPRLEGALYGLKGCEVTLTIEFERGAMRFCSVAVSIVP